MKVTLDISEESLGELAAWLAPPSSASTASFWFDTPRAAEYCCMKEQAIRDAHRAGYLRAHKAGNGRLRYHVEDLEAFLRGEKSLQTNPPQGE